MARALFHNLWLWLLIAAVPVGGLSCAHTEGADKAERNAPASDAAGYPIGSSRAIIIEEFGNPDSSVRRGVDEPTDRELDQAVQRRETSLGKRVARYDTYLIARRTDGDVVDLLLYDPEDRLILVVRGLR